MRWARSLNYPRDVAAQRFVLGRAHFALALQSLTRTGSVAYVGEDPQAATSLLNEAVDGLRGAGQNEQVPLALLARAAFRRAVGDWASAARDLDEAQEIAEPGPMRLYLCDCALERTRLALARREAFAPLNGFVEPSPPAPALPSAAPAALLLAEARKELDVARELIAECGYHRRDEELAECDAVVAGGRRFADLPARV